MARTRKPVSGPSALSQRTDLAPGGQPVRVPTGQPYGERSRLISQQQAAPMHSGSPAPGGAPTPPGGGPLAGAGDSGMFSPTRRPNEPITEGVPFGPGSNGPMSREGMTVDRMLQAIYNIVPSEAVLRLMNSR